MQFGVCGPDKAKAAAGAGFAFVEGNVGKALKPRENDAEFAASLQEVRELALPMPVVNCFVPGDLKITGPDADLARLEAYVRTAFARSEQMGVEVIVFGSGGARNIPEGFDRDRAWEQIVDFCRMLSPLAHDHGVTVVVEPLNRKECNVLTSVGESARLVREVNHPALRLLVDSYHWGLDNDSVADVVANGELFGHVHVASFPARHFPGADECDLRPFFAALAKAGYDGRVSIECGGWTDDLATDLQTALVTMQAAQQAASAEV